MKLVLKIGFLTLLATSILFPSCKSLKNKKAETELIKDEGTSRFIVSFYSPGNGIDRKAKAKFDAFLENFEPTLAYTTAKWGREGEVDYCFDLDELTADKQVVFVNSAKELLTASKKVRFSENEKCRESR